jgi:hypothetical protein
MPNVCLIKIRENICIFQWYSGCAAHIRLKRNKRKCGDFRSRFEAKKSVFFRFVRMEAKHSIQRKKEIELSKKRKEKPKTPPSSPKGIIIFQAQ